jgi:protein O-GlcNAc transferase
VFANFNQIYKIDPAIFAVWMRILKRVPHSVLWLLRFPPSGEANIRAAALSHGVGPDRLVFTDVAAKDEHIRRGYLADLFLDTPVCNAHTTGCDILWSGTPMLTLPGERMASRVAASLLNAAGLPQLVADSHQRYEDVAVSLAEDMDVLLGIRGKLEDARLTCPLFDTQRWVRNLEAGYKLMWARYEMGQAPGDIDVPDTQVHSTCVAVYAP